MPQTYKSTEKRRNPLMGMFGYPSTSGDKKSTKDSVSTTKKGEVKVPTYSNLLVFLYNSADGELYKDMMMACAQGLARQGSTVCLVGHSDKVSGSATTPQDTNEPNLYMMPRTTYKATVSQCDKFDYVIAADDRDSMKANLEDLFSVAGRIIVCNTRIRESYGRAKIADKCYVVMGHTDSSKIYLSFNADSKVRALSRTDVGAPEDETLPVVATYWKGVDAIKFSRAVIGTGDPMDFYLPYRTSLSNTQKTVANINDFTRKDVKAYIFGTVPVGLAVTGAYAAMMDWMAAFAIVAPLPVIAVGALYANLFRKKRKIFSDKVTVEDIYPPSEDAVVRPAIAAPPMDGHEASALYASDMMWTKIRTRHDDVRRRWNDYEMDISKMLDAPLLSDYSVPQTAALVLASTKAKDALALAEESGNGRGKAVARGLYAQSVSELEIAFEVAEKHALKVGIRGFAETEQRKIARSKQLFALAQDSGASDAERSQAVKQARKELEGIIVIPEAAVQNFLEAAHARPALTAN